MEKEQEQKDPKAEILSELKRLRDDYSDEIPDRILDSTQGKEHKVQKTWFTLVVGALWQAQEKGFLSEDLGRRQEEFSIKYCESDFPYRLTTREEIEEANALLDEAINALEPKEEDD